MQEGSGTHQLYAGTSKCQSVVKKRELLSWCQHPAQEEMGSSLEQDPAEPCRWLWLLGVSLPPCIPRPGAGLPSWAQCWYLHGAQWQGWDGSRRHAAPCAGPAGAGGAPHTAAAGASLCAAACTEVTCRSRASHNAQPCDPQTSPVVVLLQREPLIPQLPDALLVLGELLCQPPMLPTPLAQLSLCLPYS